MALTGLEIHLPLVPGRIVATSSPPVSQEGPMSNPDQGDPRIWTEQQLLLTAAEAARALHLGRSRLFALIKNGELHTLHIVRSAG